MKILTSFSGKFGDIMWALPTVRHISRMHNQPVEFMIMPQYFSLLPLLSQQSYISSAFVDDAWLCINSNHGDQPWEPQNNNDLLKEYDKVYHLGYRYNPGLRTIITAPKIPNRPISSYARSISLVDFTAYQQSITLEEPVCPFIEVKSDPDECIAYAFNPGYAEEKSRFWSIFSKAVNAPVVDVSKLPWHAATEVINSAIAFIGCRSSNYVIAHGVAQKNIFVYEPDLSRHTQTFWCSCGNPHWKEQTVPLQCTPEKAAEFAIGWIHKVKEENNYALNKT